MSNLTDWLELELAEWIFQDSFMPSPESSVYVALHTANPGEDTPDANEVNATDYDRVQVSTSGWTIDTSGSEVVVTNDNAIVWSEAQTDWGTISHGSLWNGPDSGDDAFLVGSFATTESVNEGETYEIRGGDLTVTIG